MHYSSSRACLLLRLAHAVVNPWVKLSLKFLSFSSTRSKISIIERLNSLNSKKKAKDISTYDFSTLYTKLKHSNLVQVLKGIIDFSQKGGRRKEDGNRKFISFSKREAFWCKKRRGKMCFQYAWTQGFNRPSHNWNIFRNLVFRQSIGIPMGIDPAPFWANLYLHKYESDYITNLMRSDKRCALMYRNASRFIDDECNLNDCGEFGHSFHLIYPSDLHLKCEHNGTHATFSS